MPFDLPPLQEIGEQIEREDYPFEFLPANGADRPVDLLLVSLGEESGVSLVIEMIFVNDLLLTMGIPEEYDDAMVLQFLLRLPIAFEPGAAPELALFLATLSRVMPAGAFGLSEEDGTVYHQYALHLPTRAAETEVLVSVIAGTHALLRILLPEIKEVAAGTLKRQEALKRLSGKGVNIPGMGPGPVARAQAALKTLP
jgi:hypothetical protein